MEQIGIIAACLSVSSIILSTRDISCNHRNELLNLNISDYLLYVGIVNLIYFLLNFVLFIVVLIRKKLPLLLGIVILGLIPLIRIIDLILLIMGMGIIFVTNIHCIEEEFVGKYVICIWLLMFMSQIKKVFELI